MDEEGYDATKERERAETIKQEMRKELGADGFGKFFVDKMLDPTAGDDVNRWIIQYIG